MDRLDDIRTFYELMSVLSKRVGGARKLSLCDARMSWPLRGAYFFFEDGEQRAESGAGPRVVRVGSHALKAGAQTTLWGRLRNHRGPEKSGGGNHRVSVFRLLLGSAISVREPELTCGSWGIGRSAPPTVHTKEQHLELAVSRHIREMPFLWLEADDEPGSQSVRRYIERNSIALLSSFDKIGPSIVDAPSRSWLGSYCPKDKVRLSGLWNSDHVDGPYDLAFLDVFERLVHQMART